MRKDDRSVLARKVVGLCVIEAQMAVQQVDCQWSILQSVLLPYSERLLSRFALKSLLTPSGNICALANKVE